MQRKLMSGTILYNDNLKEVTVDKVGNKYGLINVEAGKRLDAFDMVLQFKLKGIDDYVSANVDSKATAEDIQAKPQKRGRELELGADILSMRKRPIEQNNTLNIAIFSTEQQNRIAQRIIETLENKPSNDETRG